MGNYTDVLYSCGGPPLKYTELFPSVEELKESLHCWEHCGIIRYVHLEDGTLIDQYVILEGKDKQKEFVDTQYD